MPKQTQRTTTHTQAEKPETPQDTVDTGEGSLDLDHAAKTAKVKADTDALLDEIDEVLGTSAECNRFVRDFVQKSGE